MSTRDLGTGSLLSTFSVGRTGVVEGRRTGVGGVDGRLELVCRVEEEKSRV